MNFQTIITPDCLADNLYDPNWLILDCRGSLNNDHISFKNYSDGHIPCAYFCFLNGVNADSIQNTCDDSSFENEQLLESLAEKGFSINTQIILYEDLNSSFTDTIWLKLKTSGIPNVAVLLGGYTLWQEQNLPITLSSIEDENRAD